MKTLSVFFFLVVVSIFLFPASSSAQFGETSTFLGPHIGLAAFESSPTFGANFETAINKPGELGDGILAISGRADYTSFDWGTGSYYKWTLISIGAYCNYHFKVGEGKFDPFVGLGLGYHIWDHSYTGPEGGDLFTGTWSSGISIDATAGARYFFSKSMALRALLGFGVTYLVVGLDFGI
jgi:hypothetical protein